MAAVEKSLLDNFLNESRRLLSEGESILESIAGRPSEAARMDDYANRVDGVMGAARSLASLIEGDHVLQIIGEICMVCKSLGRRAALVQNSDHMVELTVSLLQDATVLLLELLDRVTEPAESIRQDLKMKLFDRLKWINEVYKDLPLGEASAEKESLDQSEIDALIAKLGQ